jgi:hypothetical protein
MVLALMVTACAFAQPANASTGLEGLTFHVSYTESGSFFPNCTPNIFGASYLTVQVQTVTPSVSGWIAENPGPLGSAVTLLLEDGSVWVVELRVRIRGQDGTVLELRIYSGDLHCQPLGMTPTADGVRLSALAQVSSYVRDQPTTIDLVTSPDRHVATVSIGEGGSGSLPSARPNVPPRAGSATDGDLDRVVDAEDNCPSVFNPDQNDFDQDGVGNACDATKGVSDDDSWVVFYLRDQRGRPVGHEVCLGYKDYVAATISDEGTICAARNDGYLNSVLTTEDQIDREVLSQEALPAGCTGGLAGSYDHRFTPGSWRSITVRYSCEQLDSDLDTVLDFRDNCKNGFNPDQLDLDEDGVGDSCDATKGVPAGESRIVFYMRDQEGRPVGEYVCFRQTDYLGVTLGNEDTICATAEDGYVESVLYFPSQADRRELVQEESPPGCTGGLRETFTHRFASGSWRAVTLRFQCGRSFADVFTAASQAKPHTLTIRSPAKTVELRVGWRDARDSFIVRRIRVLSRGQVRATSAAVKLKPRKLKIRTVRHPTYVEMHVGDVPAGKLMFDVVAAKVARRTEVSTRVVQVR